MSLTSNLFFISLICQEAGWVYKSQCQCLCVPVSVPPPLAFWNGVGGGWNLVLNWNFLLNKDNYLVNNHNKHNHNNNRNKDNEEKYANKKMTTTKIILKKTINMKALFFIVWSIFGIDACNCTLRGCVISVWRIFV